ncbi:MAG: hypothetical protein WD802_09065 [Gemmatimonadaceae bacterium]
MTDPHPVRPGTSAALTARTIGTRLAPVLLSAMLMATLTSFRPLQIPDEAISQDEVEVFVDGDAEDKDCPERIMREEELRDAIEELRGRIEEELRRREGHYHYEAAYRLP